MGNGSSAYVSALESYHGEIYAGGVFYLTGPDTIFYVGKWDGNDWLDVGAEILNSTIGSLVVFNDELYANGVLYIQSNGAYGIARYSQILFQSQQSSCSNNCDGVATATPVGIPPQTYLWSNGETTQTITGLCVGTYTVTVTDSTGSPSTGSIEIISPPSIIFTDGISNATCSICNDGTATINATGGMGGLQILWSTGDTTVSIINQPYGTYTVTITDSIGCGVTDTITISYNAIAQAAGQNSLCFASCTGSASASSNGVAPFTYQWSNGATTQTINNLCPNTYYVTVIDSNGVSATDTIVITEPPQIIIADTSNNATCSTCNDGNANITANGGTGALQILWSTGDTTASIINQLPGTYTVTISDSFGCGVTDTININYIAVAQTIGQNSLCFATCTGTASAGSNGVSPFTYQWSNSATTQSINNLCPNTYYVTVTDSNGVAAADTIVISEPTQLIVTDTSTNASCSTCNNGTAISNASGGTPPLIYTWSNGATTNTIDSLLPGTYIITVTDSNNCVITDTVTVGFDIGIQQFTIDNSPFTLYPNPADENITVQFSSPCTNCTLQITNTLGEIIYESQINLHSEIINLKSFSSGIYFLRIQTKDRWSVSKFVKSE